MLNQKKSFIIDFGNRILNKMNFSKTICLPKQALKNLDLEEGDSLKVELVFLLTLIVAVAVALTITPLKKCDTFKTIRLRTFYDKVIFTMRKQFFKIVCFTLGFYTKNRIII